MEALGNLGRRLVAWVVLAVLAILVLKIVFGLVAGFVQTVLFAAALVLIVVAAVWALNRA